MATALKRIIIVILVDQYVILDELLSKTYPFQCLSEPPAVIVGIVDIASRVTTDKTNQRIMRQVVC